MLIKNETNWAQIDYQFCLVTDNQIPKFQTKQQRDAILHYLQKALFQQNCRLIEGWVRPSYVVIQFSMPISQNLTQIAKVIKSLSARNFLVQFPELRQLHQRRALWSNQFLVQTLGQVDDQLIEKFVNHQVKRKYQKKGR